MSKRSILAVCLVLVAANADAKPIASRQASMASGVSAVFDASSGKRTVYGYSLPITITRADAGKMLEIVAESPKPITVELWDGEIKRTETDWYAKRQFLGSSGKAPSTTPSLKWMAEPGTVTVLFLDSLPPGQKPEKFLVSYGKELRTPTAEDKAEWEKAVAEHNAALAQIEAQKRAVFPPFTAMDTYGRVINTQNYRGKVVLIDFWASWCGPCRVEMPNVVAAYQKYQPKGFEIIGVSLDEDAQAMQSCLAELGMAWPQIYDGKGWEAALATRYQIHAIPASFLLDGTGRVIGRDLGGASLERAVAKAVAELAAPKPPPPPESD